MSYIKLRGCWCDIIVPNVHARTEEKTDDIKDRFCEEREHVFHNFPKYHIKFLLNVRVHRVSEVMQTEIYTAEPLVLDPSHFEVESAIGKLKQYKSKGSDQILAELIQGGEILHSKIHKLIISIWHKETLPDQWKESIIAPVHKKGDKADCSNNQRISLLSTSYKLLSNILLSRLSPYIDEIIGAHQCGFLHNKSTTDQIVCIHQILEKKVGVQ
ncbi:hypothetical protein B7P43_G07060 [Cryptotermes secundus]|uniref:Uncharacterized protein n=1 Tax=Cryptotermes secundus TaxID=105785 RepID=A0A2J7QLH7_9NEOP|nr:hypothetical protein B7P43_G07060 [Cryptotermes secundus]